MRFLRAGLAGAAIALAALAAPALAVEIGSPSPTVAATQAPAAAGATMAPSESPTFAPQPSPSASPFMAGQGNEVPILPYLLQLLVVTGIVGGIGYFSLQYLQKKMPGLAIGQATGKQLRLVEKLTIDPKRMVFMVNVGNRYWLMASTDTHVTTVAELSKDDLGGQFAQLLEQEKSRGESP